MCDTVTRDMEIAQHVADDVVDICSRPVFVHNSIYNANRNKMYIENRDFLCFEERKG